MKKKDEELVKWEFVGDDYTVKYWQREDCHYYATVLYETDDDATVIYTSKAQQDIAKARSLAMEAVRKHEKRVKEEQ